MANAHLKWGDRVMTSSYQRFTTVLLFVSVEYVTDMNRIHTTDEGQLYSCELFFSFPLPLFPPFLIYWKCIIAKLHVNRWNRQEQRHVSEQQQLSSTPLVCSVGNLTPSLKRRSSTPVTGRRGCNGHIVLYIVFYMCFKGTSPDDWGPENEQYMSNLMCREMHRYVSKARFMTLRGYCLVTAADERFVSVFRKARNWWYSTPVCHRALGFRCVSTSVVTP